MAVVRDGVAERWDVLGAILIQSGKAVGNGFESEVGEALDRVGSSGFEEAVVIEFSVDEGDEEASEVEELGQLEKRIDMALDGEWKEDKMSLVLNLCRSH